MWCGAEQPRVKDVGIGGKLPRDRNPGGKCAIASLPCNRRFLSHDVCNESKASGDDAGSVGLSAEFLWQSGK